MELWTIVFVAIVSLTRGQSLIASRFQNDPICDINERIADGCTKEEIMPRSSLMSCLAKCNLQSSCFGASLEKDTGKCFIHEECHNLTTCDTPDSNHDYYSKYCVYGQWDNDKHSCVCDFGAFGDRCIKGPKTCVSGGGIQYLDLLNDGKLYKVRCRWHGIQLLRNDGAMSFNRTWSEYVNGFESADESNHWLGLKFWHVLSQPGCLYFLVQLDYHGGNAVYQYYKDFVVGNRDANYSFTYSSRKRRITNNPPGYFESYPGDCWESLQNLPFSTWDMNNGGDSTTNCASQVGFGWWYPPDCNISCNYLKWGVDDWNAETSDERFSMLGVDMALAAPTVDFFEMWISQKECP